MLDLKNLTLEQKTKRIINSYRIEELRQSYIKKKYFPTFTGETALKGHYIFKKFHKLRNHHFNPSLAGMMAEKFDTTKINKVIDLRKTGVEPYGCMNLVENFNSQDIDSVVDLIFKGLSWCYASLCIKNFNNEQIQRMLNLKNKGLTETQAYHKIEINVFIDLEL